jgi:hypothetical protein
MPNLLVTHKLCGLNHHREWEKRGTQRRLGSLNGISVDSLNSLEHVMGKPASQTAVLSEEKSRVDGWEFEGGKVAQPLHSSTISHEPTTH